MKRQFRVSIFNPQLSVATFTIFDINTTFRPAGGSLGISNNNLGGMGSSSAGGKSSQHLTNNQTSTLNKTGQQLLGGGKFDK
jgi:hypothetical protein